MNIHNTSSTYGLASRALHWISALIIIGLCVLGLVMESMDPSPQKYELYGLHKSFGILILMILGVRILWKVITPSPDSISTHKLWEKLLAKSAHVFLYLAMIGMPISGWLMSSAGGYPVKLFGLPVPPLTDKNEALSGLAKTVHEYLGYTLMAIIILHVIGALKHHIIDKDNTLKRMIGLKM